MIHGSDHANILHCSPIDQYSAVVDKGVDGCNSSPCGECEGDCDHDSQCKGDLRCFQRTSSTQTVPGCENIGYVKSTGDHDYCYNPGVCGGS